jgi:uncharacterized damage-inducible protein DinB
MDFKTLYTTLARYNQWANQRVYQACNQLDAAGYHQNRAAFFRSIHGTLNHILLADRVWMGRFTDNPYVINALDDELYANLDLLQNARQIEDHRIMDWVDQLSPEAIASDLAYTNVAGQAQQQPLWQCLSHFFNHQTHHRGQVHQMLGEANLTPPSLDLVLMLREPAIPN